MANPLLTTQSNKRYIPPKKGKKGTLSTEGAFGGMAHLMQTADKLE